MKAIRLLVLSLCVLVGMAAILETLFLRRYGWDYQIYCGSLSAVQADIDPYYASDNLRRLTGSSLGLPYPVGSLVPLSLACAKPQHLYPVMYAAVLALAGLSLVRLWPGERLATAAFLISGLAAAPYCFLTGNIGILELACLTGALVALSKDHCGLAGLSIGSAAAVKLTPLAFVLVFAMVLWRRERKQQLGLLILGIAGAFALVHGLSVLISPKYEMSRWLMLTGAIPGQSAPLEDMKGNWTNPALPLILLELRKALDIPRAVPVVIYVTALLSAVWLFFRIWRKEADETTVIAYGILLTCLTLPRFKPYTFSYAVVPIIYLFQRQRYSAQVLIAFFGGVLPTLAFLLLPHTLSAKTTLGVMLGSFQYWSMLTVFLMLVWAERNRWGARKEAPPKRAGSGRWMNR